jgi:hypothetical protein
MIPRSYCWSRWQDKIHHRKCQPYSHRPGRHVRTLPCVAAVESADPVPPQENTYHGLIPEYQNCAGCDSISYPRLSARKGIRRFEDSKQSNEAASFVGGTAFLMYTYTIYDVCCTSISSDQVGVQSTQEYHGFVDDTSQHSEARSGGYSTFGFHPTLESRCRRILPCLR